MAAQLLTGSKQEIVEQLAKIPGEVHEVLVFIDEPSEGIPATPEELFAEMEPYTVQVGDADDSREAIYTRMEGE